MKPVSKIDRYVIRQVKAGRLALGYSLERLNEIAKILQCAAKDFLPDEAL